MKMKCTQYGLYGQPAFKNARVKPGTGGQASGFLGVALACHPIVSEIDFTLAN